MANPEEELPAEEPVEEVAEDAELPEDDSVPEGTSVYWRGNVYTWAPHLGGWVPAYVYRFSQGIDAPEFTPADF